MTSPSSIIKRSQVSLMSKWLFHFCLKIIHVKMVSTWRREDAHADVLFVFRLWNFPPQNELIYFHRLKDNCFLSWALAQLFCCVCVFKHVCTLHRLNCVCALVCNSYILMKINKTPVANRDTKMSCVFFFSLILQQVKVLYLNSQLMKPFISAEAVLFFLCLTLVQVGS